MLVTLRNHNPRRSRLTQSAVTDTDHAEVHGIALAPVTAAATQVMDGFRKMAERPGEVEISFGVTLDGKLGGVIASAEASAHLDVTLRWRGPAATPDGAASQDTPSSGQP